VDFKEWLIKEVGTSTANVAAFQRITIPLIRRQWVNKIVFPDPWEEESEDEFFRLGHKRDQDSRD